MANENKALTVEGEALDTVNNDTQLSVASVTEPMEISASVTRALADSLAKIAAYVPINYVDNMEPDINAANLNQNEQALMRVTALMNSAVDVIKDLQSQVNTNTSGISQLNSDLNMKVTKSGTYTNDSTVSDIYKTMSDNTVFNYFCSTGSALASELGITNTGGGTPITIYRGNSWRGFAIAVPFSSSIPMKVARIAAENTLKWTEYMPLSNIRSGAIPVPAAANANTQFEVTFPEAFRSIPVITVSAVTGRSDIRSASVLTRSATGFTGSVYNGIEEATIYVFWIAVLS